MTGLLLVGTNIPEDLESGFNERYNREHMRDRILGVPGFTRGRRFVAFEGGPRYLAIDETRDVAVLQSEPYLALKRVLDPFIPTLSPPPANDENARLRRQAPNVVRVAGRAPIRVGIAF